MATGLESTYKDVIQAWGLAKKEPSFAVTEFEQEGILFNESGLKVIVFFVDHVTVKSSSTPKVESVPVQYKCNDTAGISS